VLFHGSQNGEPIPFVPLFGSKAGFDPAMETVGYEIYNRWLADFVSLAPHRHIGLAYVPAWDIDATIATVEWAHDAGLHAVNFPSIRQGVIRDYNDRAWEPFWSACEERKMPLVTHVGGNAHVSGPEGVLIHLMEGGGWMARRAIWWLIFAGVFERHPGLKLVITETPGNWWPATVAELDSLYDFAKGSGAQTALFTEQIPQRPSQYMATNVYFGASFAAPFETAQAMLDGFDSQLMWGSDYPHHEGTFVNPEGKDMPSVTRIALRNTFNEVPEEQMRRMVGGNAIDVYNLDRHALAQVAREIGAPTPTDIALPIDRVPEGASTQAFRTGNPWT
jgi:predicted TIM-barrel fold metal-dependent hydrolase